MVGVASVRSAVWHFNRSFLPILFVVFCFSAKGTQFGVWLRESRRYIHRARKEFETVSWFGNAVLLCT